MEWKISMETREKEREVERQEILKIAKMKKNKLIEGIRIKNRQMKISIRVHSYAGRKRKEITVKTGQRTVMEEVETEKGKAGETYRDMD